MTAIFTSGLEEALTSPSATTRIVARASASTWTEQFQQWLNDEFQRGEDPSDIIIAVMQIQVMTHSSVTANLMKPAGFVAVANAYKQIIDERYVHHAQLCKQSLKEMKA